MRQSVLLPNNNIPFHKLLSCGYGHGTKESEGYIHDLSDVYKRQPLISEPLKIKPEIKLFLEGVASYLNADKICKELLEFKGNCCGYVGGILFANQLGLTTKVPGVYEIYTNKATTEYRETQLASLRVILRKPYCAIDEKNAATLQFLDLLKEIVDISEVDGEELTNLLIGYMKKKSIGFESMRPFLPYYPERIYKNMYEVGLLNGVSV